MVGKIEVLEYMLKKYPKPVSYRELRKKFTSSVYFPLKIMMEKGTIKKVVIIDGKEMDPEEYKKIANKRRAQNIHFKLSKGIVEYAIKWSKGKEKVSFYNTPMYERFKMLAKREPIKF